MRFLKAVSFLFLASSALFAQTFGLMPAPRAQFFDASGRPLAGGCLFSYQAGTSIPSPTYTDSNGTASNPNPTMLDSGGRGTFFLNTALTYKITLTAAPLSGVCAPGNSGTSQWTQDGVTSAGGGGGSGTTFLPLIGGTMTGSILVGTSNTIDLGSPTASWRNLYLGSGLFMGGVSVINSTRDATIHNLTVSGTCTGCSGSGAFLPLAGGTMTGDILVSPNDTVSIGASAAAELKKVWVKDINISGSCTGAGCGGGGSFLPLTGGTMSGNIAAGTNNTYNIGSPTSAFSTGYFVTAVNTRVLEVHDQTAPDLTSGHFSIFANVVGGNNVYMGFNDGTGQPLLQLIRTFIGTNTDVARFDTSLMPLSDNTRDIGGTFPVPGQAAWRDIFFKGALHQGSTVRLDASGNATVNDLTIIGTCSGCPGSGGGSFLPIAGGTMTGNIAVGTNNLYNFGAPTMAWSVGYFQTAVNSKTFEVHDGTAADLNTGHFSLFANVVGGNNVYMGINDNAGNPMAQFVRTFAAVNTDLIRFDGSLVPFGDNTRDIGGTFPVAGQAAWRDIYYKGRLVQNGVTTIDASRNATFNNLTVASCTGCGGGGGGGVSSVTAGAGPVTVSPTTGAVVVSCPSCPTLSGSNTFTNSFNTFNGNVNAQQFVATAGGSSGFWALNSNTFGISSGGNGYFQSVNIGSAQAGPITVINSAAQFIGNGVNVGSNGISAGNYQVSGGFIGQSWDVVLPSPFTIVGQAGTFTTLRFRGGILVSAQ